MYGYNTYLNVKLFEGETDRLRSFSAFHQIISLIFFFQPEMNIIFSPVCFKHEFYLYREGHIHWQDYHFSLLTSFTTFQQELLLLLEFVAQVYPEIVLRLFCLK